jgi:poly-gamma-glutamate synthesis protein (capsule biosynthesis protein)
MDGNNARLVAAVRAIRPHVDAVIVDLHYGSDLQTCPTEIQRGLDADLVRAGAAIVVGQHAHVLHGAGYDGDTNVDYGFGNIQFYVSGGGPQAETGVLTVTLTHGRATRAHWVPGRIESGLPYRSTGSTAAQERASWNALRGCTGLTATPTRSANAGH